MFKKLITCSERLDAVYLEDRLVNLKPVQNSEGSLESNVLVEIWSHGQVLSLELSYRRDL